MKNFTPIELMKSAGFNFVETPNTQDYEQCTQVIKGAETIRYLGKDHFELYSTLSPTLKGLVYQLAGV